MKSGKSNSASFSTNLWNKLDHNGLCKIFSVTWSVLSTKTDKFSEISRTFRPLEVFRVQEKLPQWRAKDTKKVLWTQVTDGQEVNSFEEAQTFITRFTVHNNAHHISTFWFLLPEWISEASCLGPNSKEKNWGNLDAATMFTFTSARADFSSQHPSKKARRQVSVSPSTHSDTIKHDGLEWKKNPHPTGGLVFGLDQESAIILVQSDYIPSQLSSTPGCDLLLMGNTIGVFNIFDPPMRVHQRFNFIFFPRKRYHIWDIWE